MTAYWDFRQILDVYPEESPRFNCVCIAPSKGRRCRNPAKDYRKAALILDEMDILKKPQYSFKLLESLAFASLCQHYHNGLGARGTAYSQVNVMVRQWERSIDSFLTVYNETASSMKVSTKLAQQKLAEVERAAKTRQADKRSEELSSSSSYFKNVQPTVTVKYEKPERKDVPLFTKTADDPFVSDTVSRTSNFTLGIPKYKPIVKLPPPVSVVSTAPAKVKEEKISIKDLATTVSVTEVPCSPLIPPVSKPSSNEISSTLTASSTLTTSSINQSQSTRAQQPLPTATPLFETSITMQFGSSSAPTTSFSFVGVSAIQATKEAETNLESNEKPARQSNNITPKAVRRVRAPYEELRGRRDFNDQLSTVFDSGKAMDSIKSQHVKEIESTPTKAPVTSQVSEENFGYAYVAPQPTRYTTHLPSSSTQSIDDPTQEKLEPLSIVSSLMSSVPARKPLPALHVQELVSQPADQVPVQKSEGSKDEDEKRTGCLHILGLRRFKNWIKSKSSGPKRSRKPALDHYGEK